MYFANSTIHPLPGYDITGPVPDESHLIIISSVVLSVLSVIFVVLRLLSKICFYKQFHLEDYTLVGALIMSLLFNAFSIPCTFYGLGRHVWNVRPEDLVQFKKYGLALPPSFTLSHLLIKFSFAAFYDRLYYKQAYPWVSKIVYAAIFSVYGVFFIFHAMSPCIPARKWWDPTYPPDKGFCFNLKVDYIIQGVYNLFMDIVILLLPIPILLHAKVTAERKFLLCFVFGMGLFCCATSLLRITTTLNRLREGPADVTWNVVWLMCWSMAEMSVGIIVCSMLQLNRLLMWVYHRVLSRKDEPQVMPVYKEKKPVIPQNSFFGRGRKPRDIRGNHTRDIESAMKSEKTGVWSDMDSTTQTLAIVEEVNESVEVVSGTTQR